ncbi:MAG TPA: diacylglycerol kinase family protein [Anaerolineales bacterium]|nr:diacylglycerol kinase family protein [Anaerolineales bacterium]
MQVNLQEKPKTYIVVNPVAGLSQLEVVRETIQSALEERGIPFEFYETTGKDNLKKQIHEAIQQGFKLFMAAGGDGTLSAVVDGLAGTQLPLVILPAGTWNTLARAFDIPLQIEEAIQLVFQEHQIRTIDALQVNQSFFILNVSAGLGAQTIKGVKREEKRRFGKLVDLWKGIKALSDFRSYLFEVKIDGKLTRFRASELMVANSATLGIKPLQLDQSIRMDDGKMNVCRIYANSFGDYLKLAISMLRGEQERNWNVLCVEALKEVEIHSRVRLPVQGDGDVIGQLPVTVKIRPKAIHIVTPIPSG